MQPIATGLSWLPRALAKLEDDKAEVQDPLL